MQTTRIEWCDSSVNPTAGCGGCELWNDAGRRDCYAGKIHTRFEGVKGKDCYREPFGTMVLRPGEMAKAAAWSDLRAKSRPRKPWLDGMPRMIFISDMSDCLSVGVPFAYLRTEIIDQVTSPAGSRHLWLWLTKRPLVLGNFKDWLWSVGVRWPANLVPGVSVTSYKTLRRMTDLRRWNFPRLMASFEPLLGPPGPMNVRGYDWFIAGGMTGPKAPPVHPEWVRVLRDTAIMAGIPFFFKGWGEWVPRGQSAGPSGTAAWEHARRFALTNPSGDVSYSSESYCTEHLDGNEDCIASARVGHKQSGRFLDGCNWLKVIEESQRVGGRW
jgi:protein gp37